MAAAALMLGATCTQPSAQSPSPSISTHSPSPVAECRLPVAWNHDSASHRAFVGYPSGDIAETAVTNGDVYDAQYQRWVSGPRELISPDGSRYTYWSLSSTTPTNTQVHVVDTISGVDRTAYDGATNYWPIAFAADGIYAMHAINLKQNSLEGLFRLDPAGGRQCRCGAATFCRRQDGRSSAVDRRGVSICNLARNRSCSGSGSLTWAQAPSPIGSTNPRTSSCRRSGSMRRAGCTSVISTSCGDWTRPTLKSGY